MRSESFNYGKENSEAETAFETKLLVSQVMTQQVTGSEFQWNTVGFQASVLGSGKPCVALALSMHGCRRNCMFTDNACLRWNHKAERHSYWQPSDH